MRALLNLDEGALRGRSGVTVIRDAPHALTLRIQQDDLGVRLYWKDFRPRNRLDPFKEYFRRSKAARAWRGGMDLLRIGLHTAPLVAYGETPWRGQFFCRRSFLVTAEIAGAQTISAVLQPCAPDSPPHVVASKREVLRAMGRAVGRMHEAGIYHGDLRPNNILYRFDTKGRPELFFIDTDRVLRHPLTARHEAVRNLMQLIFFFAPSVTLSDRQRVLDAYAEAMGLGYAEKRRMQKAAWAWLQGRVRRRLRRAVTCQAQQPVIQEMRRLLQSMEARRG